ncbi:MAG: YbaB/EbfC family nucleoid-associated protein [Cyclobacteriaceae bacterium]|nr:YbaB/EbfC family nucleoid-associated protein [Cyclobacteriaceae bacterium]
MFDMMNMMGKMKEVQAKMKEAQANLVNVKSDGESGGGMVKATVNGSKQVEALQIDDELIKIEDKEMLQDLVIAAINKALQEVEGKSKEELKKSTEGLIPNIPGLDLSGLM